MTLDDYKEILDFAIEREIEAQGFYKAVAEKMTDSNVKEMFLSFVKEEEKHEEILKGILKSERVGNFFDEKIDYKISETLGVPKVSDEMTPSDAFALAAKNEEAAMNLYTDLSKLCADPEQKKVFDDLAAMERGHKLKMEDSFVQTGYPEVW